MVDLKALRQAKGLTQEQLAVEAHVGRTAITNIESGLAKPSVATAQALGSVLGFEWWKFFEDDRMNLV